MVREVSLQLDRNNPSVYCILIILLYLREDCEFSTAIKTIKATIVHGAKTAYWLTDRA
jgi:hypothetical protein